MTISKPAGNQSNSAPASTAQDILDHAPIGIFTSTPEGRFLFVNPALVRMLGYDSPTELIESVTDIGLQLYADPSDREKVLQLLGEHGVVVNHECRFHRRDGTEFWGCMNVRAVRDQDENVVAYQGFTSDISGRKQADWVLGLTVFESEVLINLNQNPSAENIVIQGPMQFEDFFPLKTPDSNTVRLQVQIMFDLVTGRCGSVSRN